MTPRIRTHALSDTHWCLLVDGLRLGPYRTAGEVKYLEDRIRQLAKDGGWEVAVATVAKEQEGHEWKPLRRKPKRTTVRHHETPPPTTVAPPPVPMPPPSPQVAPQQPTPPPEAPEAKTAEIAPWCP